MARKRHAFEITKFPLNTAHNFVFLKESCSCSPWLRGYNSREYLWKHVNITCNSLSYLRVYTDLFIFQNSENEATRMECDSCDPKAIQWNFSAPFVLTALLKNAVPNTAGIFCSQAIAGKMTFICWAICLFFFMCCQRVKVSIKHYIGVKDALICLLNIWKTEYKVESTWYPIRTFFRLLQ